MQQILLPEMIIPIPLSMKASRSSTPVLVLQTMISAILSAPAAAVLQDSALFARITKKQAELPVRPSRLEMLMISILWPTKWGTSLAGGILSIPKPATVMIQTGRQQQMQNLAA